MERTFGQRLLPATERMLKKVKSLGKALRLTKKDEVAGLRRSMSEEDAQLAPTYKFRSSGELTALTMLVEETRMRLGLLGGKSVARVRCSEALEDILAVLTEQRAGLDRLEFAADAGGASWCCARGGGSLCPRVGGDPRGAGSHF